MEDCENSDYHLLAKIRDIKNITGTRFGDIILAALSANLYKYFQQVKLNTKKKKINKQIKGYEINFILDWRGCTKNHISRSTHKDISTEQKINSK